MKKLCFLLILALLLSFSASAFAEDGVEIIYMDGIPVVMESFGLSLSDSETFDAEEEGFKFPAALAEIGEEAFAGIPASRVEITENVKAIGPRAFADCPNLTALVIPATVESIDDSALEGSTNVTIYCEKESAAYTFAVNNGIDYTTDSGVGDIKTPDVPISNPVVMPYVAF